MGILPVAMSERLAGLTLAVGWALVWFLVQGLLVGLVVAVLLRAVRGRSADLRCVLAAAGLLVMALCPLGTTLRLLAAGRGGAAALPRVRSVPMSPPRARPGAIAGPGAGGAWDEGEPGTADRLAGASPRAHGGSAGAGDRRPAAAAAVAATNAGRRWRERVEAGLPAVVAAWLAGVVLMALRLMGGILDVRRLTRRDLRPPTEELQALIGRLVERSGLRRPVSWFLSLRVEVPTVVGWLRPTILIPVRGVESLTLRQVEALLAHEIAHVRRCDYLVNLAQVVVEAVLFYHPAVWWLSRRIRIERENCCDDAATALCGGDRLLVARALLTLEEQRCGPALRVAAGGGSLKSRVRRLVAPSPPAAGRVDAGWSGGILAAVLLGPVAAAWFAGPTVARQGSAPGAAQAASRGRAIDEAGDANVAEPVDIGEVVVFGEQAKLNVRTEEGAACGVAFSPDGHVLGTVATTEGGNRGGPGELRLGDVSGRRPPIRLEEPAGLRAIAFAPDGKTLATGGHDRTVKLRDAATGTLLRTLGRFEDPVEYRNAPTGELFGPRPGFGNVVSAVAFSGDGRFLAAGCLDESVQVWDTTTWKAMSTVPAFGQPVLSLAFSPDGKTLAVGTGDPAEDVGILSLFEPATLDLRSRFGRFPGAVESIAFAPDGSTIAVASRGPDAGVSLHEVTSGKRLQTYAPNLLIHSLAFAPDGMTIAAGLDDGSVVLLDSRSPARRATIRAHSAAVLGVAYSPDGRSLASASRSGSVRIWGKAADPLALAHTVEAHRAQVWFATFSPDGKTLATGSGDSTVRLWDAATMDPVGLLRGHAFGVSLGLFTPDGKGLITSGYDRTIRVWDLASKTERLRLTGHTASITFLALSADGRRLASSSEDNFVALWDPIAGKKIHQFPRQPHRVVGVAFSPDGKTLAAAVGDRPTDFPGFVRLWDVESAQERATLGGFPLAALKVAYSPDGRLLAASSQDGTIKIWDAATAEEKMTLAGEVGARPLAFSPDGKTLASGHARGALMLWDVASGRNRLTQKAHDRDILGIAFAPDGRTLATASGDRKARLWRLPDPRRDPRP